MGDDKKVIKGKMQVAGVMGPLWCTGWLFTAGYLHLSFGKLILAFFFWPYFLGSYLGG
jgi:hypothetical protein